MPDVDNLYYRWTVPAAGKRGGRRTLRWEMQAAQAVAWAANAGVQIERVEGSGTTRIAHDFANLTGRIQGCGQLE